MADEKPIIIIKKKGGHGGHHGGAWKVAYADFVTAMMAFFMVMWLVNSADVTTRQNIASYFRKPGIFESGSGTPLMVGEAGILSDGYVPPHPEDTKQLYQGKAKEHLKEKSGTDSNTSGSKRITYRGLQGKRDSAPDEDLQQHGFLSKEPEDLLHAKQLALEKAAFLQAAEEIKKQLSENPGIKELLGMIDIKVDGQGLNIEIMDTDKSSMFESGSARVSAAAKEAFKKIMPVLSQLPNKMDVIGHTDAQPFSSRPGEYSNWELSADRANAARRLLESTGIDATRFAGVAGRADKELKDEEKPLAPENRRITLRMRFSEKGEKAVEGLTTSKDGGSVTGPLSSVDAFNEQEETLRQESAPQEPQEGASMEEASQPTGRVSANEEGGTGEAIPEKGVQEPPVEYRPNTRVKLPNAIPTENLPFSGKDKIFGERPVVGPRDPFADLP